VPAQPGSLGQNPEGCKMVVVVVVFIQEQKLVIHDRFHTAILCLPPNGVKALNEA